MRILKEVADRGSFSAAAEALSYTQSAVSQQIAALEREAGTQLVTRGSRGIRLTEAGEALVRHADAILTRLADAEAELEAIAGLRGGRLRLAAFPTVGATLMPLAIAHFRGRHPDIELTVRQLEPEDSLPLLKMGELDIALTIEPNTIESDGLDSNFLLDDPMFAALPLNHPLAHKSRLRLKDLKDEAWIGTTDACSCGTLVRNHCIRSGGFDPQITFESDDYLAIQGLVAAGVGVAMIPTLALTTVRDDIIIRDLGNEAAVRTIAAATLPGAQRSPAARAMLDVLTEVATQYAKPTPHLAAVAS
ncbi:MAG TPA: LysR family transcriptional regulator [Thermoleophilaceae bacterium]|nr:LysR family transcriptional regulator [Thermoleophilaceae bacterium]